MHSGLYALIAIALALTVFAVLHHRKVRIGLAMLVSSLVLACLLKMTPQAWWGTLVYEWHHVSMGETTPFLFVSLTGLVLLVNVLGAAMQETGVSKRLVPALIGLFRSRRTTMAGIPLIMGMLPTPGGIMLSAPMVRELGDATGVRRESQAAINFFFRHQLESVWPLFPAVPLVQAMLQVTPGRLLAHNLAISLSGVAAGTVFLLLRGFPPAAGATASQQEGERRMLDNIVDIAHALWPIGFTIVLYAAFNVPAALGILAAILVLLLFQRVSFARWGRLFAAAMEWDFVLLIAGALLYKLNLDGAGAVKDIAAYLGSLNIPVSILVFVLPFIVGYVTGVTMPTVAMTFPVLKGVIGEGGTVDMGLEVLAFAGVIVGLFLTPVHLCLALSASYFEVPLWGILRLVLAPTLVVAATAFAVAAFL